VTQIPLESLFDNLTKLSQEKQVKKHKLDFSNCISSSACRVFCLEAPSARGPIDNTTLCLYIKQNVLAGILLQEKACHVILIQGNKVFLISLYEKESMKEMKCNCCYCKDVSASPVISNYHFSYISVDAYFPHDAFEKFLFNVESSCLVSKQNVLSKSECAALLFPQMGNGDPEKCAMLPLGLIT